MTTVKDWCNWFPQRDPIYIWSHPNMPGRFIAAESKLVAKHLVKSVLAQNLAEQQFINTGKLAKRLMVMLDTETLDRNTLL
jgi:hypothetical protein